MGAMSDVSIMLDELDERLGGGWVRSDDDWARIYYGHYYTVRITVQRSATSGALAYHFAATNRRSHVCDVIETEDVSTVMDAAVQHIMR